LGVEITSTGFSQTSSGSTAPITLSNTNHLRGVDNNTNSMTGLQYQSHYIMDITWTFTLPEPANITNLKFTRWIYGQFDGGSSQRYVYLIQSDGTRIPVVTSPIGRKEGKRTESYDSGDNLDTISYEGDWQEVVAVEFRGYARKGSNGGSSGAIMLHEMDLYGLMDYKPYMNNEINTYTAENSSSNSTTDQLAWDGWVSLSGEAEDGTTYGPTRTGNQISGYSWGDDVVGWIDMSGVSLSEPPAQCGTVNGANNLTARPTETDDLCNTGTLSGVVSQSDQDSWTWTCLNESSTAQCSASTGSGDWICGDEVIPTTQNCGDTCPLGSVYNETTDQCDSNATCSDGIQNQNETGIDIGGVCDGGTSGEGEITSFMSSPRIIKSGDSCNLEWAVNSETPDSLLCEVISDNPDDGFEDRKIIDPAQGTSGTVSYDNVTSSTDYTMSCYVATGGGAATSTIKTKIGEAISTQTARCIINPNFQEF